MPPKKGKEPEPEPEPEGPPPPEWFKPINRFSVAFVFDEGLDQSSFWEHVASLEDQGIEVIDKEAVSAVNSNAELAEEAKQQQGEGAISAEVLGALLHEHCKQDVAKAPGPTVAEGEAPTPLQSLMSRDDRPHKLLFAKDMVASADDWAGLCSRAPGVNVLVRVVKQSEGSQEAGTDQAEQAQPQDGEGEQGGEGEQVPADGPNDILDAVKLASRISVPAPNGWSDCLIREVIVTLPAPKVEGEEGEDAPEETEESEPVVEWQVQLINGTVEAVNEAVTFRRNYDKFNFLSESKELPSAADVELPDMRHYSRVLNGVPADTVNVGVVLHALIQQVCLTAGDKIKEGDFTVAEAKDTVSDILLSAGATLGLKGKRVQLGQPAKQSLVWSDGDLDWRLASPGLSRSGRVSLMGAHQRYSNVLQLPEWPEQSEDERTAGVERTELASFLPKSLSPAQHARALILAEFENLVGHGVNADSGEQLHPFSRGLTHFCAEEALQKDTLIARIADARAISGSVVATYFARDDVQLVACCQNVPFRRTEDSIWSPSFVSALGLEEWSRSSTAANLPGDWSSADDNGERWTRWVVSERVAVGNKREMQLMDDGTIICKCSGLGGDSVIAQTLNRCAVLRSIGSGNGKQLQLAFQDNAFALLSVPSAEDANSVCLHISTRDGVGCRLPMAGPIEIERFQPAPGSQSGSMDWATHTLATRTKVPVGTITLDGDVAGGLQKRKAEDGRIVLPDGSVSVQFADGSRLVMLADGCVGEMDESLAWSRTNASGQRVRVSAEDVIEELPSVTVSSHSDAQTGRVVISRSDLVIIITEKDGTRLVQHADGTEILTRPDGASFEVSAPGYPSVEICAAYRSTRFPDGTSATVGEQGVAIVRPDTCQLTVDSQYRHAVLFEPRAPNATAMDSRQMDWLDSYRGNQLALQELGQSLPEPCLGTLFFDLHTGEVNGKDDAGDLYGFGAKGNSLLSVRRVNDFENAKEEAIVAQEKARMRAGLDDVPVITIPEEAGPVLEAHRLFIVERDGSGIELITNDLANSLTDVLGKHGADVRKNSRANTDGGGNTFVCTLADYRQVKLPSARDGMLPLYMRYRKLVEPWASSTLLVRRINVTKAFTTSQMQDVRNAVVKHRKWRIASEAELDDLVVPDFRQEEAVATADSLAEELMKMRLERGNWADPFHGMPVIEQAEQMEEQVQKQQPRTTTGRDRRVVIRTASRAGEDALRPSFFDSSRGQKYLSQNPPDPNAAATIERKRRRKEESAQEQHQVQQQEQSVPQEASEPFAKPPANPRSTPPRPVGPSHTSNAETHLPLSSSSMRSPMAKPGHVRTAGPKRSSSPLHLHKRAAEFDVKNKPRKHPIRAPGVSYNEADPDINEHFQVNEESVRRKVSTVTAQQKRTLALTDGAGWTGQADAGAFRAFRCSPAEVNFGQVEAGGTYVFKVSLMNCGDDPARFRLVQPRSASAKVVYRPAQVAPGMAVTLEIHLTLGKPSELLDQFSVITHLEKFNIPISAVALDAFTFREAHKHSRHGILPPPRGRLRRLDDPQPLSAAASKNPTPVPPSPSNAENADVSSEGASPAPSNGDASANEAAAGPNLGFLQQDWVVDTDKSLDEIKSMTADERAEFIRKQNFKGIAEDDVAAPAE